MRSHSIFSYKYHSLRIVVLFQVDQFEIYAFRTSLQTTTEHWALMTYSITTKGSLEFHLLWAFHILSLQLISAVSPVVIFKA